jgi:hypothetical protein
MITCKYCHREIECDTIVVSGVNHWATPDHQEMDPDVTLANECSARKVGYYSFDKHVPNDLASAGM